MLPGTLSRRLLHLIHVHEVHPMPDAPDCCDSGVGPGVYVHATQTSRNKNYQMCNYAAEELPDLIEKPFPTINGKQAIIGHSTRGHSALIYALYSPGFFTRCQLFRPFVIRSFVVGAKTAYRLSGPGKRHMDQLQCDRACQGRRDRPSNADRSVEL